MPFEYSIAIFNDGIPISCSIAKYDESGRSGRNIMSHRHFRRVQQLAYHDLLMWYHPRMTKEEWLARCAMAYDVGLVTDERLGALYRAADAYQRLVSVPLGVHNQHQGEIAASIIEQDIERCRKSGRQLASDDIGYGAVKLAAIFDHFCQQCATDPRAWWTRQGFCEHRNLP